MLKAVYRDLRPGTLSFVPTVPFERPGIYLDAEAIPGRIDGPVQAADVTMDHNLATLYGNKSRIHLYHGPDRQQVAEADVQVADHDLMPCRPCGQAQNLIEDSSDAAAVSVGGRTLGDRTEPDPCYQVALPVTEVLHPETVAGPVSRDKSQGFSDQGRSIKKFPSGFASERLFCHLFS
jgi:hypothetical protein